MAHLPVPAALLLLAVAATLAAAPAAAQQAATNRPFDTAADVVPIIPPDPGVAWALDYAAPAGCPDEHELRAVVASRMGRDPFGPATPRPAGTVRVRILHTGAVYSGTVEQRDPAGRLLWSRPPLPDPDCRRLVGLLGGTTIPAAIEAPPPGLAPPPASEPAPPPPAPAAPPPSARPRFRLGARGALAIATAPGPTAAISADVGVGWPHFSLALEGRADLPRSGDVDAGTRLRTSVLAASLVPCGRYRWAFGCALVTVGSLRAEATNALHPGQDAGILFAAGVRAGIEWPAESVIALRVSADALVNLHRMVARVDETEVWVTPPFSALLGAGLVLRL